MVNTVLQVCCASWQCPRSLSEQDFDVPPQARGFLREETWWDVL